ncbi:MAG TPA: hypothetical protein VFJ02_04910 [Vicinamibacterales bacterium]|nr:hypothetical protein [Vicinamibacterales bacterium]
MIDTVFTVETGAGRRDVHLDTYLTAAADERAIVDSIAWIKSLRDARVDGIPLRRRFTFRGDSLWWFAELYLHKEQVITTIFRALAALDALIERERPRELHFMRGSDVVRGLAPQVAAARQVRYHGPQGFRRSSAFALAAMEARSSALHTAARASRRRDRQPPVATAPARAVAFVHRAFWRADGSDGSAESYIGAVLAALERKLGDPTALAYVSVGPAANFRARRWWHPIRSERSGAAVPIESYAPRSALAASYEVWRERHDNRRALWKSADLRMRSVIQHCDCWPLVRIALAGIAVLQWPWSARAMDEAAAVLDALQPGIAVTYAEAGGWGRAIVLESRRRGIPSVGLQHGFIYRHWLNYLHEPDEMIGEGSDLGFPHPTRTLLFDAYAAQHLTDAGHFAAEALAVTGSPRLDALAADTARLSAAEIEAARAAAGAAGKTLVVVATKHREARRLLPALIQAAATMPDVHVAIKAHPAEPADVYSSVAGGHAGVSVLESAAPLAPLLRACRALVTVNSTLALDAAVLDVPALVIGLPNNLSPFVEAGILAGAADSTAAGLARALEQILYHEGFRSELAAARRAFLAKYQIGADGHAAERSADAILDAARQSDFRVRR